MTKKFSFAVLFAALSTTLASAIGAQKAADPVHLTLRIYNYAGAHPHILKNAKRKAERVFVRAAIEVTWLDCPTSPEQIPLNRQCAGEPGPSDVLLNLLPHSMSKNYGFKRGVFGFALPTPEGMPASRISLFFKRVLDLAYHGSVGADFEDAQAVILGHMMAHEVGHLLLGTNDHSASGVMSFPWNERTLTKMERGQLHFSADERRKIRRELVLRARVDRQAARRSHGIQETP